MTIHILCLVCGFFLIWILILKAELAHMKKELDRAKTLLETKLGNLKADVKIDKGRALKGREAESHLLKPP